ncbi:MAG: hypothetical protein ACRCV3_03755 [Desulfovibrionaceae bacterium]
MPSVCCHQCSKDITISQKRIKDKNYCSRACYAEARNNKKIQYCFICSTTIKVRASSKGKYCSRECASVGFIQNGKNLKIKECAVCKKEFRQAHFMDSTCSTQCDIIHYKLKPLFLYEPEKNSCVMDNKFYLRNVDPILGF